MTSKITPDSFVLDICTKADAPALSLIGAATFLASFVESIDGDALVKHCLKEHSLAYYEAALAAPDPRHQAWILRFKPTRAPVGYLMTSDIQLPVEHTSADVEVKRIYLLPEFVGYGLGAMMMDQAAHFAKSLGAARLLLGTYEGNDKAVAFYRRAGFAQIGKRGFNVGGIVYDDIVMAKQL